MNRISEQEFFQRRQAHKKDAQYHQRKANKRFKIQLCFKIQFKDMSFKECIIYLNFHTM